MEPDKDFAGQMDKRALRKEVRARRMALILVTLLTVLCAVVAVCMLVKAVCIVNDGDHLLIPLLMTVMGTDGLLALLAGWLLSKE